MIESETIRCVWRHLAFVAAFAFGLHGSVQAAALTAYRVGITPEKTRVVFQLDGSAPYQINVSDQGVQISFDELSLPPERLSEVLRSNGGLLKAASYGTGEKKTVFQLNTTGFFSIQYFELEHPSRLVIDLFPEETPSADQFTGKARKGIESGIISQNQPQERIADNPTESPAKISSRTEEVQVNRAGPPLEESKDSSGERPATGINGARWLYVALPLVALGIAIFWLLRLRTSWKQGRLAREGRGGYSEFDSERIDFQTLIQRETAVQSGENGLSPPRPAAKRSPAYSDVSPYLRELNSVRRPVSSLEPIAPQSQVPPDDVAAELNIEEGKLIWPAHLLDGDRRGRVMVVDDELDIVKVLEEYLTEAGYEVQGLTDSRQALEKFGDWRPDLLILDVVMPGLSGVEFVQEIRKENGQVKVIFLSGKSERGTVAAAFDSELQTGLYEFFKKPISLQQIGGRVRDYFGSAQELLVLNLRHSKEFSASLEPLGPPQLAALHSFVWDRIIETSAELLGRRIEPVYVTDRMEPASNYMRRMGCQERRDYCIAKVCIVSNPVCAANRLRAELEVMRQILAEFRDEYLGRVGRSIGGEDLSTTGRGRRRESRKATSGSVKSVMAAETSPKTLEGPPPKRLLRRLVTNRNR